LNKFNQTYGRFFVSSQRDVFQGKSLVPPNDVAQHVIAVASATLKKYGNLTGDSSHGQYGGFFAVVGVSLKQSPKPYCFLIQKTAL